MLIRILVILCAISPFTASVEGGIISKLQSAFSKPIPQQPPSIRVLLAHDQPGVVLEVKGKYKIFDPRTNQHIITSFEGKRKFIQALRDGLRWGEEFPGIHQIVIVPDDRNTTTIVDGIEYRGAIYVYDVGGSISVVNQVDIEEYLDSILPTRYTSNLPDETLAAIAITARTNAYYQAQNAKTPYWDIDASKVGYQGYAVARRSKPIDKAIYDTRYMVLYRIGQGDWAVTPFAVDWRPGSGGKILQGTVYSAITLEDAEQLAKKGSNASQILEKAFPNTSIQLMHYTPYAAN